MGGQRSSVTIVVASIDRPEALSDLIARLRTQSEPADEIILSVTGEKDLPADFHEEPGLRMIMGPKGSCAQRNSALDRLSGDCELVVFCDDDFLPSHRYVEQVRAFFAANPDVAGASGKLLADGINGPGISAREADDLIAQADGLAAPSLDPVRDLYGLYGCNMAFRRTAIGSVRFDERLPLYGWQEDIDFAAQIREQGRIVATRAFYGVHRGVKRGRSSGIRLGYSQIVNPTYLAMKGTMRPSYAFRIALRNFGANHLRAFRPEPWADRMGRAKGNWLGLLDLIRGRVTPERVLRL